MTAPKPGPSSAPQPGKLDRSRPPRPGPVTPFDFPTWHGHRLTNGMRLMVAHQPGVPLVHVEVLLDLGGDADPLDRRGLTALAAGLLDEGTRSYSSVEIADQVELLGASLFTTGDWDGVYVGSSSLSAHVEQLFALKAEVLRWPTFPEVEVERLRAMRLAALANRANQPGFAAGRRALEMTYGEAHPYGVGLAGTTAGLAAVEATDLDRWHRLRARPDRATLVAVGDTDLDRMEALAERYFGDWTAPAGVALTVPAAPPAASARRVAILDRPEAAQTELRLMRVGPKRSSPDYLAARLVNLMFGGKFTSRLNLNLREERGITYSVHSRLGGRRGPGPFTIACAVDNEAAGVAVTEILGELARLAGEPASPDELDDARNYLLGTFPYRVQTLEGVADHLAEIALHGLPADYYSTLPEAVEQLPAEAVAACAASLLVGSDLAIVAAGPADVLRPQLEALGNVETAAPESL